MSQRMRVAKVGDILKLNRRKYRITKITEIKGELSGWGYDMEYVTGKGFSYTALITPLQIPDTPLKCGSCNYWMRGGFGSGRGGGYCNTWRIPKVASNTCGDHVGGCHSCLSQKQTEVTK